MWGQTPTALDILALKQDHEASSINLFTKSPKTQSFDAESMEGLSDGVYLTLQANALQRVMADGPLMMSLELPWKNDKSFEIELIPSDILGPDFKVKDANDQIIEVEQGRHYWGMVDGDTRSFAAISVFDDEVIGVFATPEGGNYVLGKVSEDVEDEYILYAESDLTVTNPNVCSVGDEMMKLEEIREDVAFGASVLTDPCKNVASYIEADNILYNDRQRNATSVNNYITGLYNVVALLYNNENINTNISEIKIWTTQDPYRKGNSSDCLNDFNNAMNSQGFNGDIAHLLTTSRTNIGGRAYVNILCRSRNRSAISNIGRSYREFPTYSWTIEVVAHEMGHNLGSPHTHNCSWGPQRNQALDNCYETEGSCGAGPPATGGGTIMSYCHLTSFGINFTKGFGQEPGDLIRFRVANAGCLGGAFEAEAEVMGETTFYLGDSTILDASPKGGQYFYQWYRNGLIMPGETDEQLIVRESGTYECHVITTCFEVTNAIDVEVVDFLVSLKCPPQDPEEDFEEIIFDTVYVDTQEDEVTFDVPADLHANVPAGANSSFVELGICAGNIGISFLSQLNIFYDGPLASGLDDIEFRRHKSVVFGERCYDEPLGDFDPTGEWTFTFFDDGDNVPNSPESWVVVSIRQKWTDLPKPSDCNTFMCLDDTIQLDAGFPDLTYRWSTGDTTQIIDVTEPGVYSVTVSNNGIERSDDIEVFIAPTEFEEDRTICEGETFMIGDRELTEAGTYTDTLVSSYGCDSILTLNLSILENDRTSFDTLLCYNDTLNGVAYNSSVMSMDTYTGTDGCDSIHSVNIVVNPEMFMSFEVERGCEDVGGVIRAVVSGGSGDFSYSWSTGESGEVLNGVKTGLVTCVATDVNGCTITKPVSIGNFDSVGVEIMTTDNICFGDREGTATATTNSGTPPFEFAWSTGEDTPEISDLEAGEYTLIVTDANDCFKEIIVDIDEGDEIIAIPNVQNAGGTNNGSIDLNPSGGTPPYSFQWEDGPMTEDREDLFPGTYKVTITDANDCVSVIEVEVEMNTSIEELEGVAAFSLYPNPANDVVQMRLAMTKATDVQLELISPEGKVIRAEKLSGFTEDVMDIDVSAWAPGVYFVRLITQEGQATARIVRSL
jgi:hypothetical protein